MLVFYFVYVTYIQIVNLSDNTIYDFEYEYESRFQD